MPPRLRRRNDGPLARRLREAIAQRYFMMEQYGPDGEVIEVWEGHPIEAEEGSAHTILITGTDFAEPRTDWRERGLVPPRGYHRSPWRQ